MSLCPLKLAALRESPGFYHCPRASKDRVFPISDCELLRLRAEFFLFQARGPSGQEPCLPHQTGGFLRAGILRDRYTGVPFVPLPIPPSARPIPAGIGLLSFTFMPQKVPLAQAVPGCFLSKSRFQGPQPRGSANPSSLRLMGNIDPRTTWV